jgi:glycosyltransferase 2 family protein
VKKYARLLGSLTLLAVLAWRLDWGRMAAAFARLDLGLWLAALLVYLLTQVVSAVRWQALARLVGFGGGWGRYLACYYIGMLFNLVLPTSVGGDVVRAWYLAGQQGAAPAEGRRTAALLSVLADRVNGVLVLVALSVVAAVCCPVPLAPWALTAVAAVGAGSLVGLACLPLLPRLQRLLPGNAHLRRLADGTRLYLRHGRVMAWVTALSLVVQVANVVVVWLAGEALGLPVPPLFYGVLVPLVTLLTLLPVSVNGMGLREVGTVALLAPLGVDAASAVTLSLLVFAVMSAASLSGLGFYLFGHFPRFQAPSAAAGEARWEAPAHDPPVGGHPHQGRARQPTAAA